MGTMSELMTGLCSTLRRFAVCESGATAIEYAMIAGGVGAVVAGAVQSLGSGIKTTLYDKLASILP
jgi:Flp pilus assembly pilin Flp